MVERASCSTRRETATSGYTSFLLVYPLITLEQVLCLCIYMPTDGGGDIEMYDLHTHTGERGEGMSRCSELGR